MFGWINDCTESLVVTKFGIEKWHEIKAKADCKVEDGGFIRHQYYSDGSTVALVVAAAEVLGLTVDQVLEAFGQYFMEFTRQNGYVNLLSCQGSTLRLWLSNLNALHDHLQSSLPEGFVAPVFWCEDDENVEGSILLHYFSKRGSLLVPLVVGLVKEVARYHFDIEIQMTRMQMQDENDAKFTTWSISASDSSLQWKLGCKHSKKPIDGDDNYSGVNTSTQESLCENEHNEIDSDFVLNPEDDTNNQSFNEESPVSKNRCPFEHMATVLKQQNKEGSNGRRVNFKSELSQKKNDLNPDSNIQKVAPMSGDKMKGVFPYHIVVNEEFKILQVGDSLEKLLGLDFSMIGLSIKDVLSITRPVHGSWDWMTLSKIEDQTFFLEPASNDTLKVKLKGNILNLSVDPKQVMFVLSPDVKNISELNNMHLTMSDLPLYSFQRDAVFLGEHISSEVKSAHKFDKLSKKLANERNLSNTLLYSMLPKHVADHLRSGQVFEPASHDNMTLFFSDVVGFTSMCAGLDPWDVIDMLNQLYTVMDFLAAKFNLYKVETIGDAYMCCSGVIEENENHAQDVANFAIAVRKCVQLVKSPLTGEPISIRMGIHSGSCMSGVVGTLTPHYCLFGDMINTTSRHESTGVPDKIHVSSVFYGKIFHFSSNPEHFQFEARGLVDMKGKGMMFTYFLDSTDSNPYTGPEPLEALYTEVEDMFIMKQRWKKRSYFRRHRLSICSGSTLLTQFIESNPSEDGENGDDEDDEDNE